MLLPLALPFTSNTAFHTNSRALNAQASQTSKGTHSTATCCSLTLNNEVQKTVMGNILVTARST
eukprot:2097346-Amphidinium_carterae.2